MESLLPAHTLLQLQMVMMSVILKAYHSLPASDVKGHFDLVIKAYPDGVVSSYLHGLKVLSPYTVYCTVLTAPCRWATRSR